MVFGEDLLHCNYKDANETQGDGKHLKKPVGEFSHLDLRLHLEA